MINIEPSKINTPFFDLIRYHVEIVIHASFLSKTHCVVKRYVIHDYSENYNNTSFIICSIIFIAILNLTADIKHSDFNDYTSEL